MGAVQQGDLTSKADVGTQSVPAPLPTILPAVEVSETAPETNRPRISDWLRTGTGVFSSVIGVLAATLTVVFLLIPSLKPEGPTTQFSASFSDARIETDVALSDYYARMREVPPSTLSGDDLLQRGVVVSFTVLIEGFKGKECRLIWSVFDASTNKRSQQDWLVSQDGWPVGVIVPEGSVDQGNGEIFVPEPPTAGSYFVRLELNDPDGTRLTTVDSPAFVVSGTGVAPAPITLPTESGA